MYSTPEPSATPVRALDARPGGRLRSVLIAWACALLAVALPALTLYALTTGTPLDWLHKMNVKPDAQAPAWAAWRVGLALLSGLLPSLLLALALLSARACLLVIGAGEGLSQAAVRHLRAFAAGMFAASFASLLCPTLAVLLLTTGTPGIRPALALDLNSSGLLMLLMSGIVWQISTVMTHAVAVAEDHAQIV